MSLPGWKMALPTPPDGGQLLEAWFTTYQQPDASLLVEHLLPSLLGLDNSLTSDAQDRNLYFGELSTTLERFRGRLTIISSPPRNRKFKNDGEEQTKDENAVRQSATYPWLWRYINHFTVGARSLAVQHAKLWVFHWQVNEGEFLEMHVSSTNLTTSAFKGQIQAGWSSCIKLETLKSTKTRQKGWSELIEFLNALGDSAGENAKQRIDRLVQLLGRANCPDGITFVASTPGSDKRGAHALKKLLPKAIHILAPTIGDWTQESLAAWSKDAGVDPKEIHLKWVDGRHPWARTWALAEKTGALLQKAVQLNHLKPANRFHSDYVDSDERWSHAKLYLLQIPKKKKRHLLLTSANWSVSAWGAGGNNKPRNFELGVLFESDWKWLEKNVGDKLPDPFCVQREQSRESMLQWAEVSWDGKIITLCARSINSDMPINATIGFSGGTEQQIDVEGGVARAKWSNAENTPLNAKFTQGNDAIEVIVLDLRPASEFTQTPLPEVDPALSAVLRDSLLLQRYGGPAAGEDGNFGSRISTGKDGGATMADYSVQAWLEARDAFHVVDQWKDALERANVHPMVRAQVLLDGRELRALFTRRAGPAASLVAEEIGWRIDEET